jgi:hypothetical protein
LLFFHVRTGGYASTTQPGSRISARKRPIVKLDQHTWEKRALTNKGESGVCRVWRQRRGCNRQVAPRLARRLELIIMKSGRPSPRPWIWRRVEEIFGLDLRSLALFRIMVGLTIIGDLIDRATDLRAHYSDEVDLRV